VNLLILSKAFLRFSLPILSSFSHISLSYLFPYLSYRILVVREFVFGDQEKRSSSVPICVLRCCKG